MTRLVETQLLSAPMLKALLSNEILAVRISSFLSPEDVRDILIRIDAIGMEMYVGDTKGGTLERKGKIGPNLFRFKDEISAYFERVQIFERETKPLIFEKINIPERLRTVLKGALSGSTSILRARSSSMNRDLSECTVRSLPSAPPHTDWIKVEMPGFDAVASLTDQFAWNVYISTGEGGGQTLVYNTEDKLSITPGIEPDVTIQPQPGDLVLFRSRNVHAVMPTQGDRVTVSGFFGPRSDGHIQYWI